ncbi:sugar ABC transporter substrate-binding protein [soil metagenome]
MKKVFYTLLAALLVSLASAQTLTLWNTGSETDALILDAAAALFEASHEGVTVDIQPMSWQDGHTKVLTAVVSGSGPDMITGGLSWGIEFGEQGGMVDLKAAYPDIVAEIESLVQPGIYHSVVPPTGEVYGVPIDLTFQVMMTRPDLIEAAGLSGPPQTWEELTAVLEADNAGLGFGWGNAEWIGFFPFLYQAGGALYDTECSEATINSPEGVEALTFFADLYNTYGTSPEGDIDVEGGLESGEYAVGFQNSSALGMESSRPELFQELSFSPLPAGPSGKRTSFIGGRVIGIMEASNNQDLAAEFIASLYTSEAATAIIQKAEELNQLWITPVVEYAKQGSLADKAVTALEEQLADAEGPPNCTGWEESQALVVRQLQEVIFSGADPQAALDAAAEEMNKNLN